MAYREDRQAARSLRGSEESSGLVLCGDQLGVRVTPLCRGRAGNFEGACGQLASTVDLRIHAERVQGGMEPFYI